MSRTKTAAITNIKKLTASILYRLSLVFKIVYELINHPRTAARKKHPVANIKESTKILRWSGKSRIGETEMKDYLPPVAT